MALSKTVSTVHGLEAINAYHRVEGLSIEGKESIKFYARSYKNTDLPFFSEQAVVAAYDLNGANPIAQAYRHLKTLPEFVGSMDC
jgi:hypothetical protein